MNRRRGRAALATSMAVVLLLSGCTDDEPRPGPVDDGAIAWTDCFAKAREDYPALRRNKRTECGTVTVPKDWNDPDNGETLDIAVMRIYTGDLASKRGSVLTNPGGPGGSGLTFLPSFVDPVEGHPPTALLDEFVLVTFDPRGVGESAPIKCISDKDMEELFAATPDPVSQAAFDEVIATTRRVTDACYDQYGDDLRLYSTVQAAHDMDAIREALGEEKLTYLGFSYGTLLGAVYAQLHPTKVRALVLDGAIDPREDPIASSEGQARGFERALTNFDAWCRRSPAQCPIYANPRGAIVEQLQRAAESPLRGTDGRLATDGVVMTAVVITLYAQSYWIYLGQMIDELRQGDPRVAFILADTYAQRDEDGHYSNLFDANLTVNCTDVATDQLPSLEEVRALQSQWREKYPFFGTSMAVGLATCSLWRGGRDPYPTGPATGAPPILVVGTAGDPATPVEATQGLADMLGVGVVVLWEGEGHTAYPETECIRDAVDGYLIDLKVPEDGLTCPA